MNFFHSFTWGAWSETRVPTFVFRRYIILITEWFLLYRALSYARQALYNDCGGGSTAGCVHLTVAAVSLELGAFSKAMDAFQKALAVAQAQNDNTLLLQVSSYLRN